MSSVPEAPQRQRRRLLAAGGAALLAGCGSMERLPIRSPDAPFIVTREEVVEGMLRLANVGPNDVVYDLGCGDGRIPVMAAQKFGARGVGVDLDTSLLKLARQRALAAGVSDRVEFRVEDLFKTDVRPATVVALFLLPEMLERLKFTFREQLRPGSRIVSNEFGMGGDWPPDRTTKAGYATIHLWVVK